MRSTTHPTGAPVIPLGTVLVTGATKVPCGYNLDDGRGNAPETHLAKVESDNDRIEAVSTYNSPCGEGHRETRRLPPRQGGAGIDLLRGRRRHAAKA